MNAVFFSKKLIGTAITLKSSTRIVYPSISVCTDNSEIPLDYSVNYRQHPNNSWIMVSPNLEDVDNRDVTC